MKKTLFSTIALLGLALSSFAQEGLLWKISGNGLESSSYLFGTFHVDKPEVNAKITPVLMEAMAACDVVAGELDFDDLQDPSLISRMLMQDQTLEELLPKKKYNIVLAHIRDELGIMGMMCNQMHPIFTSVMLSQADEMKELMNNGGVNADGETPIALDQRLQMLGDSLGLDVVGIETINEQFDAFLFWDDKTQAKMLYAEIKAEQSGKELPALMGSPDELDRYYIAEDLGSMHKDFIADVPDKKTREFLEVIVDQRNTTMQTRLELMMREGTSVFCAVGALHLPGKKGLINTLKEAGYTLERVVL